MSDVVITDNALARYRERFDPAADRAAVAALAEAAEPVPSWVTRRWPGSGRLLRAGQAVLVLEDHPTAVRVVTVWEFALIRSWRRAGRSAPKPPSGARKPGRRVRRPS